MKTKQHGNRKPIPGLDRLLKNDALIESINRAMSGHQNRLSEPGYRTRRTGSGTAPDPGGKPVPRGGKQLGRDGGPGAGGGGRFSGR